MLKRNMNVMICDDSPQDVAALLMILDYSYGSSMKTAAFYRASDALEHIRAGAEVDLCILETRTEKMDGIAFADELRGFGYRGAIVFVTRSNSFGPDSFMVNASDYVMKPPIPDLLRRAVSNAEKFLYKNNCIPKGIKKAF